MLVPECCRCTFLWLRLLIDGRLVCCPNCRGEGEDCPAPYTMMKYMLGDKIDHIHLSAYDMKPLKVGLSE